ncbi:bifunctional UDP-N-acetylglucosamine diphosphorylase/glucosamine-1-phosphate N-acetyltransferase GlmU [Ancylobacter sp. SL191]|uniref:bifunctional UDP-N-acetylglucosamine diphosphorylase/glucosamine-1-phosphate N-acetyltransferase GlmU n=1 Tax=Ancylobacter sp. SL191 TaxID=2995166 RepID=UPI002271C9F6|nr:bifunctional UDP-N-acetylglucosamine diphosphorylase/glucosamine-1-phosphate N-acetyltransferase GlmU [Ancylobacter sp. SL191]WAC26192.1 bifunctional UDP-N-acetylglucosamine diphosphorylase/glucosamine-1-phosphate N-acetyltransferase GlmU [Ancylobacter sp. SL191]
MRSLLVIVLAAGEGTRMRSAKPKVLHAVANRPMVAHVLDAALKAGASRLAVVIGPDHEAVAAQVRHVAPEAGTFVQAERRGTAHAVLAAREALAQGLEGQPFDDVVVMYGDTPLVRPETIEALRAPLADGAAVSVLGFRPADPFGYGRLVTQDGELLAIREEKEASEAERAITLCNAGLMAFDGRVVLDLLDRVSDANAKKEFYLTDAVEIARALGRSAGVVEVAVEEVAGVNSRAQLAEAESILQKRLRARALEGGATLVAPETVFFSADTVIGRDVVIEPNVVFGPGVTIEDGATIRAFSHVEGAHVGAGAIVGPFARLRPGAALGQGVHVGNFVEIKAADLAPGVKVNHLSYVGDSSVGANTNIGAGTITCNYDGFRKHRTTIGANAFIGTNTLLVAPVSVGDGAYIGTGSVITDNVPEDLLAIGRARQVNKLGWAVRLRERLSAGLAPKT